MENSNQSGNKLYIKRVPILWWAHRWVDIKFISRELTSVIVAAYSITFLFYVRSVSQGPEAFARFSEKLNSPWFIGWHCFGLIALLYHSITWFNLAPKAMVVKVGETKIPGVWIALFNYLGWIIVSVFLFWLFLN
jgi:fumarate reductase subunit C